MSTKHVTVSEANGRLEELIAAAKRGEEVIIENDEHEQVQLVMMPRKRTPRVLGLHEGLVEIGEGFNEPLPDRFWFGDRP